MANPEHVKRLKRGVKYWNAWRSKRQTKELNAWREQKLFDLPDLSGAELVGARLRGADLCRADLRYARLRGADLSQADLSQSDLSNAELSQAKLTEAFLVESDLSNANLSDADLEGASLNNVCLDGANLNEVDLSSADLDEASLNGANLNGADLGRASLVSTNLRGADLTKAALHGTVLSDVDLTGAIGLETCRHYYPSIIDHLTLQKSGLLPLAFLRGVGLPDNLIEYLPSLLNQAIQYYSCFISYSSKDQDFAERIHADLQNNGVRCWFAPHDMPIGGKIWDEIASAIRLRDKVLLILSEHSIKSDWVEDEVTKAFEEERKRGQIMLFPLRLDNAVMDTNEAWAAKLRARHIGDFRRWKDHDGYKRSFDRVLRDLKTST